MPVVGSPARYVEVAEVRTLPNLGGAAFTDAEIEEAIAWFEDVWEEYVGMAFVPRTATERVAGVSCTGLRLSHWPVISVQAVRLYTTPTVYTSFTAPELADIEPDGIGYIHRLSLGYWPASTNGGRNLEVDYTHGQPAPTPSIRRQALVAIQEHLLENHSGRPVDRTYGVANDGVFVRNILPDADKHPFGIASVDALAVRMRAKYHVPAVA